MNRQPVEDQRCLDIPEPIVILNRATLIAGVLIGVVLQQPLFTTALFLILLFAIIFGQKASIIFQVGKRLFASKILTAPREDRRLMRFNNTIATVLLGMAQLAFLIGLPVVGWIFALMVAGAASVALAGFCVGCFLYYQFRMQRYKLFR